MARSIATAPPMSISTAPFSTIWRNCGPASRRISRWASSRSSSRRQQGEAVEHKVKLPERWIKGFLQVQAVHRQAQPRFELDRLTAGQLLMQIPASASKTPVVPGSRSATSRRFCIGSPRAGRVHRGDRRSAVAAVATVLPDLQTLRVYQTEATGASLWVADTGAAQFTLGLSGRRPTAFPAMAMRCAS